jgi:hypothetical protein
MRRLRLITERVSPTRRRVALAAVMLVVLATAAALSAPHRHRRPVGRTPTVTRARERTPPTSLPVPAVAAADLARARRAAARFLRGYLQLAYGRGSAASVAAVTPALRDHLLSQDVRLTPAERRRRPRMISLQLEAQAREVVVATAMIADGGITTYPLRLTLRRGTAGWLVSRIDGR